MGQAGEFTATSGQWMGDESGGEANEEVGALAMAKCRKRNHIAVLFGFAL